MKTPQNASPEKADAAYKAVLGEVMGASLQQVNDAVRDIVAERKPSAETSQSLTSLASAVGQVSQQVRQLAETVDGMRRQQDRRHLLLCVICSVQIVVLGWAAVAVTLAVA